MKKEHRAAYMRAHYRKRRTEAVEQLGGRCRKCGGTDELEFDHADPATKTATIASMWRASEERFQAELAKCQLLCKPCHLVKTVVEITKTDFEHGTERMYSKRGCRCGMCRDAHAAYRRITRAMKGTR